MLRRRCELGLAWEAPAPIWGSTGGEVGPGACWVSGAAVGHGAPGAAPSLTSAVLKKGVTHTEPQGIPCDKVCGGPCRELPEDYVGSWGEGRLSLSLETAEWGGSKRWQGISLCSHGPPVF